jgi:hypothetical protein
MSDQYNHGPLLTLALGGVLFGGLALLCAWEGLRLAACKAAGARRLRARFRPRRAAPVWN